MPSGFGASISNGFYHFIALKIPINFLKICSLSLVAIVMFTIYDSFYMCMDMILSGANLKFDCIVAW